MTERTAEQTADAPRETSPHRRGGLGLSGKLLALTLLFVTVAEILIFVPSIANFRLNWLNDRLAAAHTAALVLDAAPSGMVPEPLARQILDSIDAQPFVARAETTRALQAGATGFPQIEHGSEGPYVEGSARLSRRSR